MRRLLVLALAAWAAWWLLSRRREHDERVIVGYEDGTSVEVEPETAVWGEAIALAHGAHRA